MAAGGNTRWGGAEDREGAKDAKKRSQNSEVRKGTYLSESWERMPAEESCIRPSISSGEAPGILEMRWSSASASWPACWSWGLHLSASCLRWASVVLMPLERW